jgi:hypothetical protein
VNKAVLLQIGVGEKWAALLDASRERHSAYCRQHGFDYVAITKSDYQTTPMWSRYFHISRLLADYAFVVYMDADALIVDPAADLRDALSVTQIGMRWGQAPGGEPWHFNAGVMYVKRYSAVLDLFDEMLALAPRGANLTDDAAPWWLAPTSEQRVLNALLSVPHWSVLVERIEYRWNSVVGIDNIANPVVVAWHGGRPVEAKLAALERAIALGDSARWLSDLD